MTTQADAQALARAVAFARATDTGAAERAEPHPWGVALHDAAHPHTYVLNMLAIDRPLDAGIDASAVAAELDRLYAGLGHRRVMIDDDATGERLARGLRGHGYAVGAELVMLLDGAGDGIAAPAGDGDTATARGRTAATARHRTAATARPSARDRTAATARPSARDRAAATARPSARESSEGELREVERAFMLEEGRERDIADEVLDARGAVCVTRPATRFFVATRDGHDVASATLYSDGAIAQIEDVGALASARGHGLGRAVVAAAIEAAVTAGHELVFIVGEEDDWPKDLYARMGFRPIGRTWTCLREAPHSGPAPAPAAEPRP